MTDNNEYFLRKLKEKFKIRLKLLKACDQT